MMFEEAKFEDGDTEQLTYKDDDNRRFLGGSNMALFPQILVDR